MYEYQKLLVIKPKIKQTKIVWINKVKPKANGWIIFKKIIEVVIIKEYNINWIISRGSLFKILILGINEKEISFLLKF